MTKIDTKLTEQISAYIDRELNENEQHAVEEQLQKSATLRDTLNDLKSTSQSVSSLPPLDEDVWFETHLFEAINEKRTQKPFWDGYKKPVMAFSTLCILFMLFFQFKPDFVKNILSEKSQALARLSNNLKPLLFATNLTTDDMFNFAFNKVIPLNKENNQVIKLGTNPQGQNYIEVKNADMANAQMDYRNFVNSLNLKPEQVNEMDKILDKYSDKIASAVLVDDKNTVAINSQIWNYHNQLRKELVDYAAQANPVAMRAITPQVPHISSPVAVPMPPETASNYYYCISADSFFTAPLTVNLAAIEKAVDAQKLAVRVEKATAQLQKKISIQINSLAKQSHAGHKGNGSMVVSTDGSNIKMLIPNQSAPENFTPGLEEMTLRMDSLFENLRNFSFGFSVDDNDGRRSVSFEVNGDDNNGSIQRSGKSVSRSHRTLTDPTNRMQTGRERVARVPRVPQVNVQISIDSLMTIIRKQNDSLAVRAPKALEKSLKQLKKELLDNINKELKQIKKGSQDKKNQQPEEEEVVDPVEI